MYIEMLIKNLRQQKKMSLKELSKYSSVSKTHINDIENNLKTPSLLIAILIAEALKVDITETYKIYW